MVTYRPETSRDAFRRLERRLRVLLEHLRRSFPMVKPPCPHCPFALATTPFLRGPRCEEIRDSLLGGGMFPCHQTTTEGGASGEHERWCSGAIGLMENEDGAAQNQMVRICGRLGLLDDDGIEDVQELVYPSWDDWIEANRGTP